MFLHSLLNPQQLSIVDLNVDFIYHIGHFLLTNLLLDKILKAGKEGGAARIVNVSSTGYELGGVRFDDCNFSVWLFPLPDDHFAIIEPMNRMGKNTDLGKPTLSLKLPMFCSLVLWLRD